MGMANTFGHLFRITTWGESHGGAWVWLWTVARRASNFPRPTSSLISTAVGPANRSIVRRARRPDTVQILSGTFGGETLGTPICMWVKNEDARPEAYTEMETKFRPSHADYTLLRQVRHPRLAGRWPHAARAKPSDRVAAGRDCQKILRERFGVEVLAYVKQVQHLIANVDPERSKLKDIEANIVRCPDKTAGGENDSAYREDAARR